MSFLLVFFWVVLWGPGMVVRCWGFVLFALLGAVRVGEGGKKEKSGDIHSMNLLLCRYCFKDSIQVSSLFALISPRLLALGSNEIIPTSSYPMLTKVPLHPHSSDSESLSRPSRTPRTTSSFTHTIPLPPSPSLLADRIESQTLNLRSSVSTYIASSPLPSTLQSLRTTLSSVNSIELLALSIEAWGLRSQVLPLRYLGTIPAVPAIGTGELAIKIPDLFAALTFKFWGPVGLWVLTSIALPLLAAWFVNLTEGGKRYDPLSFNVAKGLLAWVVYIKGGVSGESRHVVQRGVPGGAQGLLVAAGVGGLASFYEAVLRK